jgi:probable HAF family extracellular repeat protein
MNQCFTPLAAILVATTLLPAGTHADCGSSLAITVTNLPEIDMSGYQVFGLNRTGQLSGFFYIAGDHPSHPFLYDKGNLLDLGTLGGDSGQANAINNSGQIAGEAEPAGSLTPHAFLYDRGASLDLGTLGGSSSTAGFINEAGQMAGSSLTAGDAERHTFLYISNAMYDLGTLGGTYSMPFALNNSGAVAGESTMAANEMHAFRYSGGSMHDLGTLGGGYSAAFALNDSGVVVGESLIDDSTIHPFRDVDGVMTDLQGLGGSYATAFAINNAGQILGSSAITNDGAYHGFVWADGHLTDLGTIAGGSNTFPYGQNNLGQVVGQADTADSAISVAFLWQNGVMTDLNTLLPADSGWQLQLATLINDAGRIVGIGLHNGMSEWFIMDFNVGGADTNAPVIVGPDHVSVDADARCQATLPNLLPQFSITDNCTPAESLTLNQTPAAGTVLALGSYSVTITATDLASNTASATLIVTVADHTAPIITSAPDSWKVCARSSCQATVPDLRCKVHAMDNCTATNRLVKTQNPPAGTVLTDGDYAVTVSVADAAGNVTDRQILLHVIDAIAPVISSVSASPSALYPPNHEMIPVTVSVSARDNCDAPSSKILCVKCNETVQPGEIQITGDLTVSLAATRNGGGRGRIYTITIQSCDSSGNKTKASTFVTVRQGN